MATRHTRRTALNTGAAVLGIIFILGVLQAVVPILCYIALIALGGFAIAVLIAAVMNLCYAVYVACTYKEGEDMNK